MTLLYQKTLKQSMIDKYINQKEAEEIKKIFNQNFDKRKEIMKNSPFKVQDIFGDITNTDKFSQDQINNLIVF